MRGKASLSRRQHAPHAPQRTATHGGIHGGAEPRGPRDFGACRSVRVVIGIARRTAFIAALSSIHSLMARPGSRGSQGARQATARNTGTAARLNTAQRRVNFGGVGMEHEVTVADRPVTSKVGGLSGMRTKTAGPQRQIQDNTYWLSVLRSKCLEIRQETDKHKQSIEQHGKDSTTYATLERKYESFIKEVRSLEGQLADYNLAMDKTRAGTNPNEIYQFQVALRDKNSQYRREVDNIFEAKNEKGQLINKCENEIANIHDAAEKKIKALDPYKQQNYRNLLEKNKALTTQVGGMQHELEQMNAQIQYHETQIAEDRYRDEYHRLMKMRMRLAEEKGSLEEEEAASKLDPAEAREKLLAKVKQSNQKIATLDAHLKALNQENKEFRNSMAELEQELENRNNGQNDKQKYEVLFQRDQDMTQYIDKFPQTKDKEIAAQKKAQLTIKELLQHMSKDLTRQDSLPSQQEADDMKNDLSFKERNLEVSKTTQERLEAELGKRQSELEKIDQLDKKIELELNSLSAKMVSMKEQMVIFKDVDALRDAADDTRRMLQTAKKDYLKRRDQVKRQLSQVSSEYEEQKKELSRSDTAKSLKGLDEKMRHYEQNIFQLREFIETKSRETDFRALRDECGRLLDELNAFVIKEADTAISMPAQLSGY